MLYFVEIVAIFYYKKLFVFLGSHLPCFSQGMSTVQAMRERFHLNLTEQQLEKLVRKMIEDSVQSLSTKLYDSFQYFANGIL